MFCDTKICVLKFVTSLYVRKSYASIYTFCYNFDVKGYFASEYEEKLEKIRDLVKSKEDEDDLMENMIFVDTIQRLGVAGHYQKEIETIMQKHYLKLGDVDFCGFHSSLHQVSLSFRLLRQRGYHVSAG